MHWKSMLLDLRWHWTKRKQEGRVFQKESTINGGKYGQVKCWKGARR